MIGFCCFVCVFCIMKIIGTHQTFSPRFSTGGAQQEPQSAQMTTSMPQKASSKPLPFIVPRIHAMQGNFTFGSVAAPGLQNGLLGKAGMFSFRICPPSAESKAASLEQTGKAPESAGTASTLLLPGGYRLIKLPMFVSPSVSSPTASEPAEKSTEKSQERENPTTHQSSVSIKTEPGEDPEPDRSGLLSEDGAPVIIKVESYSTDSSSEHPSRSGSDQPENRSVHIKIEACHDTNQTDDNQSSGDSSHHVKIEQTIADVNHPPKTSESRDRGVKDTDRSSSVTCCLFEGRSSSVSQSFSVPSHTKTPEEIQNRRRKPQASDHPEFNQSSMYSSDGWTTEDSVSQHSIGVAITNISTYRTLYVHDRNHFW